MKKVLCIFLIVCFVTLSLSTNVMAADEFTREEAESLVVEGYNRIMLIYFGYIDSFGSINAGKYLREDSIKGDIVFKTAMLTYYTSIDGEKYSPWPLTDDHEWVTDERFDTMEKCYAYTESVFVKKLARNIIDVNPYCYISWHGAPVECFRPSEGGKIRYNDSDEWVDSESGKVVYCYTAADYLTNFGGYDILDDIGELTVTGNTASIKVTIALEESYPDNKPKPNVGVVVGPSLEPGHTVYKIPYEKEVTFTKTSEGWRISGGSFFEYIMFERSGWSRWKNPSTGDTSSYTVPALTVAAIISVALPVTLLRKRRRVV